MESEVPSELSAEGAKRGARPLQLPDWSPPDDPFEARQPMAGQGLVSQNVPRKREIVCNEFFVGGGGGRRGSEVKKELQQVQYILEKGI